MKRKCPNDKTLAKEYLDNQLSTRAIAKKYNCSHTAIHRQIVSLGINRHNNIFSKGHKIWEGRKHSEQAKEKMRNFIKENGEYLRKKRGPMSNETKEKIRQAQLGPKAWNWKGGRTHLTERLRKSNKYKNWRKQIFERDDFTCQMCNKRGVRLQADHIKSFADYPELRFDLRNGRTLCISCHMNTPNWGFKNRTHTRKNRALA